MKSARYKYIRQMSAKVQKTLKEPRRYSIITYNNVNKYNTTVSVTQHHQSMHSDSPDQPRHPKARSCTPQVPKTNNGYFIERQRQ